MICLSGSTVAITFSHERSDKNVRACLNNTPAADVKSVLLNSSAENKYDKLSAFGKNQAQKDAERLNILDLSYTTLSALLRRLE